MLRRRHAAETRAALRRRVVDAAARLAAAIDTMPAGNDPSSITIWWRLVQDRQDQLAAAMTALDAASPDEATATALGAVRAESEEIRQAVDADRALRTGTAAPSEEQLAYSVAGLRQTAGRLRDRAAALGGGATAPGA